MCNGLFDTKTVYSHSCNAFDDKNAFSNSSAQTAKSILERYLHYHNRFFNHEKSKKLESTLIVTTREKMGKLFELDKGNASWINVQFLEQSTQQLFACREILKWTYTFGYYMFGTTQVPILLQGFKPFKDETEMRKAKSQFEFHQEGLEQTTERLSGMLEMTVEQIAKETDYRIRVLDLTKVALNKFDAMFKIVDWIKEKGSTGTIAQLKAEIAEQ